MCLWFVSVLRHSNDVAPPLTHRSQLHATLPKGNPKVRDPRVDPEAERGAHRSWGEEASAEGRPGTLRVGGTRLNPNDALPFSKCRDVRHRTCGKVQGIASGESLGNHQFNRLTGSNADALLEEEVSLRRSRSRGGQNVRGRRRQPDSAQHDRSNARFRGRIHPPDRLFARASRNGPGRSLRRPHAGAPGVLPRGRRARHEHGQKR